MVELFSMPSKIRSSISFVFIDLSPNAVRINFAFQPFVVDKSASRVLGLILINLAHYLKFAGFIPKLETIIILAFTFHPYWGWCCWLICFWKFSSLVPIVERIICNIIGNIVIVIINSIFYVSSGVAAEGLTTGLMGWLWFLFSQIPAKADFYFYSFLSCWNK